VTVFVRGSTASKAGKMRFTVLDSWRGIAALAVALFHIPIASGLMSNPLIGHGYLFVDFFFVLSGFVIAHAYQERLTSGTSAANFMLRRFGRLWPLHILVLTAFIAVEAGKWLLTHFAGFPTLLPAFDPSGSTPPGTIAAHILLIQALGFETHTTWNSPAWSISAEFWCYLVFAMLCVVFSRRASLALAIMGALGGMLVITQSHNGMDVTVEHGLGFARCLFGFATGNLTYALYRHLVSTSWRPGSLVELGVVLICIGFICLAGWGDLSFAAPLIFALPVLVFSFEAGRMSSLLSAAPFRHLGDWSYSIYMVHFLIDRIMELGASALGRHFGFEPWQNFGQGSAPARKVVLSSPILADSVTLAYLVLVVVLASMTYRWIEVPGRTYFARLADAWALPRKTAVQA
jgi:peptidoglycan/LPS O-acetylase OafA/YrhL